MATVPAMRKVVSTVAHGEAEQKRRVRHRDGRWLMLAIEHRCHDGQCETRSEAVDIAMDDRKHAQCHDGWYRDMFNITVDDVEGRNSKKKVETWPSQGTENTNSWERQIL